MVLKIWFKKLILCFYKTKRPIFTKSQVISNQFDSTISQSSNLRDTFFQFTRTHAGASLEGKGQDLPYPFSKIWKHCPNVGKKCADCGHLRVTLNFSFKMQFLRVSRRKNRRFFPAGSSFLLLYMIVYQSALKILGYGPALSMLLFWMFLKCQKMSGHCNINSNKLIPCFLK